MAYTAPSGWVELVAAATPTQGEVHRFHIQRDCRLIDNAGTLRAADKPYSIRRCRVCAAV
jgi:hypothetical protein